MPIAQELNNTNPLSQGDLEALHQILKPKTGPPQELLVVENPVNDDIPNPYDPNQTDPGDTGSGDGG